MPNVLNSVPSSPKSRVQKLRKRKHFFYFGSILITYPCNTQASCQKLYKNVNFIEMEWNKFTSDVLVKKTIRKSHHLIKLVVKSSKSKHVQKICNIFLKITIPFRYYKQFITLNILHLQLPLENIYHSQRFGKK